MKKILYLCHRIPYPPNKGDKIRSFNEIKYLSEKNTIDLITLADASKDLKYKENLKKYCRRVKVFPLNPKTAKIKGLLSLLSGQSISQGYFYQKKFQQIFDQWVDSEKYDALICFSSPMAEYAFKSNKNLNQIARKLIMDFCDLDSDKWLQYSKRTTFPANLLFKAEASRLLRLEKKINQTYNRSIFVSPTEADIFNAYYPDAKNIQIISNGVDQGFFDPDLIRITRDFSYPMIMFSGAMDYYANINGVSWFAKKILPDIRKRIPDIKFYIVGSNPEPAVKALEKDPSIIVTGFVKDIREYYKAADLCVIPLRIARGIQNKVLEAMAMGKPVISTSQAVQGLSNDVKTVIEVTDNPLEFADKVVKILNNKKKAEAFGRAAADFVVRNHNWENNLAGFL